MPWLISLSALLLRVALTPSGAPFPCPASKNSKTLRPWPEASLSSVNRNKLPFCLYWLQVYRWRSAQLRCWGGYMASHQAQGWGVPRLQEDPYALMQIWWWSKLVAGSVRRRGHLCGVRPAHGMDQSEQPVSLSHIWRWNFRKNRYG